MFVQGVRDLQPADEYEYRDILTAVRELCELDFEIANIGFEAVALPHLDGEKMVVVPLSFLTGCVLGEKHFGHLFEVAKKNMMVGSRPIEATPFRLKGKVRYISRSLDYHFISKMPDVLNWVAHSEVVVESWSRELFWEHAF